MSEPKLTLAEGLDQLGLGYGELWRRYIAVGGSGDIDGLRTHIEGLDCPDRHEHNIIAQALNEAYLERGQDHPVGYQHLDFPGSRPLQDPGT